MTYGPTPRAPEARFWPKIDAFGDCWEYTGYCTPDGYGRFHVTAKEEVQAHRFAWETLIGPIPEGMVLDHLCRNPRCCNPLHLEVVTVGENNRRGYGFIRRQAQRTHCPRGHAYDIMMQSSRWCSKCRYAANREYRAANADAINARRRANRAAKRAATELDFIAIELGEKVAA